MHGLERVDWWEFVLSKLSALGRCERHLSPGFCWLSITTSGKSNSDLTGSECPSARLDHPVAHSWQVIVGMITSFQDLGTVGNE